MPTVYTVKEAADLLSVSVSTLRRIADESAAYLPDYRPISGQPRTFTDSDLRTVYAILSRLQARPGLTRSALLSELSAPGSEPLIIPASLPAPERASPQDGPGQAVAIESVKASQGSADSPGPALPALRSEILSTVASLSERIERIERTESQPDQAQGIPATPLAMAVLVSVGVLIVSLTASALFQSSVAGVAGSALALFVLIVGLVAPSMRR